MSEIAPNANSAGSSSLETPPSRESETPPAVRLERPAPPDDGEKEALGHAAGDEKTPPPQRRVPIEPKEALDKSTLKVTITNSEAGQNTFANVVNHFSAPRTEVMFSPDLASRISDTAERELRAVVTIESELTEQLAAALEKRRVILLTGAPQSGKGTVAKYIATEIAARCKLPNETFVVGPLESRVRVLPRELAADERFGGRVTIFEDALAYSNKDLFTFFRSDPAAWDELRASLARSDAYFIFTSAQSQLGTLRDRLRMSWFEVIPSSDLAATGLERKLAWLTSGGEWPAEKVDEVRAQKEIILSKLQTMPRIAGMLDEYGGGNENFAAVLERHASASPSLLDDLQTDADAWCFALTLAIAETADEPLSWSTFEQLRRLLTGCVKRQRELFPRLHVRTDDASERSAAAWLSDKPLLSRCQAAFRKDAAGLRDIISFSDAGCGRRIRQSLLDHHRRLLVVLASFLRAVAAGATAQAPALVRSVAAHTLGRIGTIDPESLTLPLIGPEWASSDDDSLRQLLAPLVRGVLASDDERYRAAALEALANLGDVETGKIDEESRQRLLTAIDVYSQLASQPSAKPMLQLREIAGRHCAPSLSTAYTELLEVEAANRELVVATSQAAVDEAKAEGNQHLLAAAMALNSCNVIGYPLVDAIARLCHDDVQTLAAMRDWLSAGGATMRLLVPYLFLVANGIADGLERFAVRFRAGDLDVPINTVIFAATASRQSQHDVAAFLCDIYASLKNAAVPTAVQQELEERLAACLVGWVERAAPAPQFRHGLTELFGTLAAARGGFMRRWLFSLVRTPPFGASDEMKAFASAARRQMDV